MTRRIEFINPFGTPAYDAIITETLMAYAGEGTEVTVSSLEGCPPNIDYYYNKHLMETVVFEQVMQSEAKGFDAVVVGCCYDPGVRVARELVDIPVIGPLEASMQMAGYFGHSYTVVTDHHKAVPYLEDMVRLYGLGGNCRGVRCVDWWVKDMVKNPNQVALDTIAVSKKVLAETRAEVVIMGCTIVAACYQRYLMTQKAKPDVAIVNPNLLALKMAESLADLNRAGVYHLARGGFYEQPQGLYREEFEQQRRQIAAALKLNEPAVEREPKTSRARLSRK
jgi:allantoin racemase